MHAIERELEGGGTDGHSSRSTPTAPSIPNGGGVVKGTLEAASETAVAANSARRA